MKLRCSFGLLAILASVTPGVRLPAQNVPANENISFRMMTLDLLHQEASEAAERERLRTTRPGAAKAAALSAANFDLNKDGKLDEAEFAAWTAELRKTAVKSPEAMKRFDTDKDGKLSDAEWAAAVEQLFGAR